jgi:hypothetical protein
VVPHIGVAIAAGIAAVLVVALGNHHRAVRPGVIVLRIGALVGAQGRVARAVNLHDVDAAEGVPISKEWRRKRDASNSTDR